MKNIAIFASGSGTNAQKIMEYFEKDSNETKELFKTLKEIILLVNKSKIILDDYKSFNYQPSTKEINELQVNIMLVEQLIEVRNNLLNQEKYSKLFKFLKKSRYF